MIVVLMLITAHNNVDRVALGLLAQNIKVDLSLSDTQLGLLTGIAFALFYSLMGIPIGRWADRGNRVTIIALAAAMWSAAVALCALTTSFLQLLTVRVGVAVGEAGCLPPTHALIADSFARAERPKIVSIYMLSGPLGLLIGYLASGWLNQYFGWRVTFIAIGLPGLLLALLARTTLREPRLAAAREKKSTLKASPPTPLAGPAAHALRLPVLLRMLWANRSYRNLLVAMSVSAFFGYGILQWLPAFFMRTYGLATGEVGSWFAVIYGAGGVLGTLIGGALATRYAVEDERLQLRATAVSNLVFLVLTAGVLICRNQFLAYGLLALSLIGGCAVNGPLFATIQLVVPDRMRATAIALIYLFSNLIGLGLGPLAAGALSDALRPWFGDASLRYALLALCPGYFWIAWFFWAAGRTVKADLEDASRESVALDREAVAMS